MQNKKIYIGLAILAFIIGGIIYLGVKSTPRIEAPVAEKFDENVDSGIVYYYGQECSHCQNVEKFLQENGIAEKVLFAKKEIWHNVSNGKEMQERAAECGIDKSQMGVPFLYANGKCHIGEIEVMDFFKKEAGI